jgi:hypothetical protein
MPNYKITPALDQAIKYEVKRLVELRSTTVEQDFPLTRRQIIDATISQSLQAAFKTLTDAGAECLVTTRNMYARLAGEGFDRACLVQMWCGGQEMPYIHRAQVYQGDAVRAWKSAGTLTFDLGVLEEHTRAALVAWTNLALRERRVARGTQVLVNDFLEFTPTLAHLDQRWPDLKLVFGKMDAPWPERVRNLPTTRIKTMWRWPLWGAEHDWHEANREKMRVAGRVLTEAAVLDNGIERPAQEVQASVLDWA